jgi:hypothetical protein
MTWEANLTISVTPGTPADTFNVNCHTRGDSKEEAEAGAMAVLKQMAHGKFAFIRTEPHAVTETDFDTKEVKHMGFVRFAFADTPGDWVVDVPSDWIDSTGN